MKREQADTSTAFLEYESAAKFVAHPRTFRSTARSAIKIAAVNLLILFVFAAIVEVAYGSWFNQHRLNRLNLIRSTTITYKANHLYSPSPQSIVYRRDEFGFRGTYSSPDQIDILTVGGSTTDQRYLTDGETWQDVLAREFEHNGKTVSVVNAGVDGQSTLGHIKDFDWWFPSIPKLHARYFLFYVGINDFHMENYNRYDDLVNSNFVTALRDNSAIYYLYRTLRGVYRAQVVEQIAHRAVDFQAIKWTHRPMITEHEPLMRERLQGYRERLRILGDKVHALGGMPICVTQTERKFKSDGKRIVGDATPFRYENATINGVDQYKLMQLINQVTLETCPEIGGVGIDLAGELQFDDSDFYDFIHNTPQGAAKVGTYLYSKLKDRL
jgi:hypothetical protein